MAETIYAVMQGNTIINLAVADDPAFVQEQGWLGPIPPNVTIGSTTPDNGKTWVPPPPPVIPVTLTNAETIVTDLSTQLVTVEAWITVNPNGGVIDPQTALALSQMMAGLTRISLSLTDKLPPGEQSASQQAGPVV